MVNSCTQNHEASGSTSLQPIWKLAAHSTSIYASASIPVASSRLLQLSRPTDKQDDGNDGAGQLLYHSLLKAGCDAWFDKFATDRSTDGMLEGVGGCMLTPEKG